jgi:hypothetical protein
MEFPKFSGKFLGMFVRNVRNRSLYKDRGKRLAGAIGTEQKF